jgi:hypothetical protein
MSKLSYSQIWDAEHWMEGLYVQDYKILLHF